MLKLNHSFRYTVRIPCPLDFGKYPHDEQSCKILIESVSHKVNEVEFGWDKMPSKVSSHGLSHFALTQTNFKSFVETYASGGYSCLELQLHFKRKSAANFIKIYIPCWLLVLISWTSLHLRVSDIKAKLWLNMAVVCALFLIHGRVPPVSDNIVALDCYFLFCLVQTVSLIVVNWIIFCTNTNTEVS